MRNSILKLIYPICLCIGYSCLLGCQEAVHSQNHDSTSVAEVHNHPTAGPRGGSLIELGNEDYHAELIHNEAVGTIAIYLLDTTARLAEPIEAKEVFVNISHDGKAEQFAVAAESQESDPGGRSSAFVSRDSELAEYLDSEDATAQLVVTIAGKQYRGTIRHGHKHHDAGAHSEGHQRHDQHDSHEEDHQAHEEDGRHEADHEGHDEDGTHEEDHDAHDQDGDHEDGPDQDHKARIQAGKEPGEDQSL